MITHNSAMPRSSVLLAGAMQGMQQVPRVRHMRPTCAKLFNGNMAAVRTWEGLDEQAAHDDQHMSEPHV